MSYTKQEFVSGQVLTAENMNHIEQGISQVSEDFAEVNKFITIVKQGSKISCQPTTFEEVIALVKTMTIACVATLFITSVDASTDTILAETYFATNLTIGLRLSESGYNWVRFTFVMSDGTSVTYQINPDNSVTEVTA